MKTDNAIDQLYSEAKDVIDILIASPEISLEVSASNHFRKALLLAAASYFEYRVSQHVMDYISEFSEGTPMIVNFVKNKAVSRQYHTWFAWKEINANQFFSLFGEPFKIHMTQNLKNSDELKDSIQAFMEIGRLRNSLIHQDYATYSMDKTLDEIYTLYKSASLFVDNLPYYFRQNQII